MEGAVQEQVCLIKISSAVFQSRLSGCPLPCELWILSSDPVVTGEQRQHPHCCGLHVLESLMMLSTGRSGPGV